MEPISFEIDQLGRREATSVATATTQKVFASLSGAASVPLGSMGTVRMVNINNTDAAAILFVNIVQAGATPVMSATDHDKPILAGTARAFAVKRNLELWVRSSGAGPVNYTALEIWASIPV